MGRWALGGVLCLGTFFVAACGGGSSNNKTTQQVRVVMASPDAPLVDIVIDGDQVATSLAYTNFTPYERVTVGQHRVEAVRVSDLASIFQQTVVVTASSNLTVLVTGPAARTQGIVLTDASTTSVTVTPGDGNVRVVNAAQAMGEADVYITNAGAGLNGATPVQSSLRFNQTTGYERTAIGNYEVFMTAPGTTNAFLDTGPLSLLQSQFQTVVAVEGTRGGFTYIPLTDQ